MIKYIESKKLNDMEILTDTGWSTLSHIHKTIPYNVVTVTTENYTINAANEHKLYSIGNIPIQIKNLIIGDKIQTQTGLEKILEIKNTNKLITMFSPTVYNPKSSYYSNGFLSENTTTVALYGLHYTLFNKNKTIAILANKMQGAKEILTRIKDILEDLPNFLKPGIKEYNKTSITFENGSKLIAAATTISAVRGLTINCLTGNNTITLKNNETNEIFDITLENLIKELS